MYRTYVACMCLVFSVISCSDADTLADEPPPEVVISGTPTYSNGVGELLALKCGYCHVFPAGDLSPDNVPDMDLNLYETRRVGEVNVAGADSLGRWIHEGILDHAVDKFKLIASPRRMPLDYGTQLTNREKDALEAWSDLATPRGDEVPPAAGNLQAGAEIYPACGSCHGDEGGGFSDFAPKIRRSHVTISKIKSMWLYRAGQFTPLTDSQAADLRSYIVTLDDLED